MLIPCLKSENECFPCAGDSSNPLANLSLEPADRNIFLSVSFGPAVRNPIPNTWETISCAGFCESAISQTDADDCARRRSAECLPEPPDPRRPPPEPPNQPPFENRTFCNDAVTCQSGSDCYTLPECTVLGTSKNEANALAQSLCNSRVQDPALAGPCSGGGGGGGVPNGGGGGSPGQTVTYEKAWNTSNGEEESARGEWHVGEPCPWPDDFASVWPTPENPCFCTVDNQDIYQWPFGEGSANDPDTIVTQLGNNLDAVLDSYILPNNAAYENRSSYERLYLRSRIEGGVAGKHVVMQGHWSKPGGAWIERSFNLDLQIWEDSPATTVMRLGFSSDPCAFGPGMWQINNHDPVAASGDLTYEFDVPAESTYYACVVFESKTHVNGPSMLHLVTTITDL